TIPIPRPLAEWLSEHRTWQEAERSATPGWTGWGHDPKECARRPRAREVVCPACRLPLRKDLLVFAQKSGRPIDGRRDWQEWADLLAELGLAHYRVHDARHFAATTLLEEGADVVVAQQMLGHSTPAITPSTYQHARAGLAGWGGPAGRAGGGALPGAGRAAFRGDDAAGGGGGCGGGAADARPRDAGHHAVDVSACSGGDDATGGGCDGRGAVV